MAASVRARLACSPRLGAVVALVAGALLPLALAPFDLVGFDLAAAALLFVVLRDAAPGRAALLGWWFGVGKYGLGASWIYVSIHEYGYATPALAGGLVALFVAAMALFPAAMTWLYARLGRGVGYIPDPSSGSGIYPTPLVQAFGFAACWVGLEWALTWVLTGFPWLYAGYAHLEDPLGNLAPVGGVLLVSLGAVLSAAAVVAAACERSTRRRAIALAVAVSPWLVGALLEPVRWVDVATRGRVALVQGNIPQDLKWLAEHAGPILDAYRSLSDGHWNNDLVIWPEAAITVFEHRAGAYLGEMDARARKGGAALVLGLPAVERGEDGSAAFLNTARVIGEGEGRYVKRRLVPFGEYVPFERWLRGLIAFFDLPMAHAISGPWRQPPLVAKGSKLAMAICYEVVYPDLVRTSARDADLLVTLSNDAWFGASIGPHQHFQMARMRALENGRFLLRATNNGITAIVDARGRVTARLPQFEAAVLEGEFAVMRGATPFARFGHGPLLLALCVLLALPLLSLRPFSGRSGR